MNIKIGVIGLGYVGLPIAIAAAKKFKTIGFDLDRSRIRNLTNNLDTNKENSKKKLKQSKLIYTYNYNDLKDLNFYIITVPTPVNNYNNPDLKALLSATDLLSKVISKGNIFVLESTVFPGLTKEIIVKKIEKKTKLKLNKDFYVGYSPERVNPGDKSHQFENINKVVSASNEYSKKIIKSVYSKIIKAKVFVSNKIEEAEASKIIENIQRDVNIALINQLAKIFKKLDIDTREVLRLSSTKWNFLNFKPGLVGGHCVSVDPYYMISLCKNKHIDCDLIKVARNINETMYKFVAKDFSKKIKKTTLGKKILIFGGTFKENCNDIRNSGPLKLANELKKKKFKVDIFDPNIKKISNYSLIKKINKKYDGLIVAVYHDYFKDILTRSKINRILNKKNLIYDITQKLDTKIKHLKV